MADAAVPSLMINLCTGSNGLKSPTSWLRLPPTVVPRTGTARMVEYKRSSWVRALSYLVGKSIKGGRRLATAARVARVPRRFGVLTPGALTLACIIVLVPSPSLSASNACNLCDVSYQRCRGAAQLASEECQTRSKRGCRVKCERIEERDDPQNRDPTRMSACLRNCGRTETCDPAFASDAMRCGSVRALCRERASCAP